MTCEPHRQRALRELATKLGTLDDADILRLRRKLYDDGALDALGVIDDAIVLSSRDRGQFIHELIVAILKGDIPTNEAVLLLEAYGLGEFVLETR